MARITEEASATVSMNMEPARKSFEEWTAAVEKGKKELEDLLALPQEQQKPSQIAKLKDEIAKATNEAEKAEKKLKTFRSTLSSLNESSFNDLYKASKELEAQIKKLKPGTEEYIAANHDLQMVNTRLKDLREGWKAVAVETEKTVKTTKESVSVFNKMARAFQQYWSMFDVAMRTISGVSMKFRQCAEDAAELDDVYSDVMKTTGLLHDEVKGLDQELMKIDTRTPREQLLLLARDAGKLGISGREDIMGFVRAADQIQVALGEDLGEGAIKNLGKIADVFGLTKEMGIEKSLLSIASAVNALGQASTASEAYLVDFTQRLAGVGAMAGLSVQDILGFASGLDQSAMKVEMAATAFQKFLMKMYEDTATFAGYAGMKVEEFSELLKTDANTAITTVMKAMNGQDGFASLVPMFDQMGLDGARAVTVLASMTQNLEAVTEAQALANEEFAKATSVSEEYQTKNNNLQAQLEKARKEFHNASVALGQSLNPIMLKSTKATTYLIKALAQYGKEIKTVLVVIVALTAALKAKVAWQKIVATWNATLRASSLALAAAQALLTGNVTRAAAAWAMMNTAMKASVFGVVAAAIAGVVIALQRLNKKQEETNLLKEKSIALDKKIADAGTDEIARVKQLSNVVHDQMRSYYERNKALEELKRLVPDYQASLTKEGELINDNIEALDNYIQKIKQSALEKLLAEEIADLAQRETEANLAKESHQNALDEAKTSYSGDSYMGHSANEGMISTMEELLAADEVVLTGIAEERKQLTDKIQKMIAAGDLVIENAGGSGSGGNGNGNGNGNSSKTNNAYQEALKDLKQKQREEENSWKELYANNKISKEKYDEEMLKINMKYLERQVKLAGEYGQDETAVMSAWLDAQIAANDRAYAEMMKMKQDWETANQKDFEKWQKEFEALQAQAQEIKDELHPKDKINADFKNELANLEKLHDAKLLSEEDYLAKLDSIHKKHNQDLLDDDLGRIKDYIEKSNAAINFASQFVTQLKEMESAQLEAEYQKQLTAAGDNAEQKEAIDAEYEQKKLDLQKKYADVEMGINIAKAIGASALAVMQAWAAAGGQPILFAIYAALIAATTAIEIATLVKQRNAIKNASVGGGGSSSVPKTGERKMTGYAEGGYTEDHTTLTTVGEKGREWVGPAWMVRKNPVMFANLERYRKAGSHGRSGSVSRGFADGGFTPGNGGGTTASMPAQIDIEAAVEAAIRRVMEDGAIRAYVVYKDIEELKALIQKFKKLGSR